jgi:hypothetical protein
MLEGIPVRVRLVVVAPQGREATIDAARIEGLLEEVVHGLGGVVRHDQPRVLVWPPQLSSQGFAPTFHRQVEKPEPEGRPSPWLLVAGPARAGARPILLGLGLLADRPTSLGRLTLNPDRWTDVLRVQAADR